MIVKTIDAAKGKWRGILVAFGVADKFLTGKNCPCPMCGGKDRFRWDNKDGSGSFICSQCGAGYGIDLIRKVKGWDFKSAADEVDRMVSNIEAEAPKRKMDERGRSELLNRLWRSGSMLNGDDMASRYLASRGVFPSPLPTCLRFTEYCPIPNGEGHGPAMLARVIDAAGRPANIHRTFLGPNGKADMDNPRAIMMGDHPDGSAIRLFPVHGSRLGIAEGIETAIAASQKFGLPVWAALNEGMLKKWRPPSGVKEVFIFGDCDHSYTGQAAAFTLAKALTAPPFKLAVQVHIPQDMGMDWADVAISSAFPCSS